MLVSESAYHLLRGCAVTRVGALDIKSRRLRTCGTTKKNVQADLHELYPILQYSVCLS